MSTSVRYTPQKRQELRSRHQLADKLTDFGWVPVVPEDLGEDFIVHIYYEGRATGVNFFVQLKSVTNLYGRRRDNHLPYPFKVKDLLHWEQFTSPVILIVWDVNLREGRWDLVDDVIKHLEQNNMGWQHQKSKTIQIPWQNNTNNDGLKKLKEKVVQFLYPKLPIGLSSGTINVIRETSSGVKLKYSQQTGYSRRLLDADMELIFPDNQEGKSNQDKFQHSVQTGEKVILKNISAKFSVPDWYKRLFGDLLLIKGDLEVGSIVPSETTLSVTLSITDKNGYTAWVQPVDLKLVSADNGIVIWSNKHQKSAPLLFTFFISNSQVEFSLSLVDASLDLFAVRDSLEFVQTLARGGEFQLISSQNDNFASGMASPNQELRVDSDYYELVDKLCEIQERTGKRFQLNPFKGFESSADIDAINEIFSVIRTGKIISHKPEWQEKIPVKVLDDILETQSRNEYVTIRTSWESSSLTLLNQNIELGKGYGFSSGQLAKDFKKEIEELRATLPDEEIVELKLVNVQIIEVFPIWFIYEAMRIRSLLVPKFGISSIYLFGSLVWGENLTPETDIDLAVGGLESEKLFKILGYLESQTQFPFDLIDLDEASDSLRERILKEGEMLYERELVAVGG